MDDVLARDARVMAIRRSLIWALLLVGAQASDAITTAADRTRGSVEAMGASAGLLGVGGVGFLFTVKLLVAAAAAATLALAARRINPDVMASRVTFRLALVAVQAATLGVVWASLSNIALLTSLVS